MTIKIERKISSSTTCRSPRTSRPRRHPRLRKKAESKSLPPPNDSELVRDKDGRTAKVIRMHERLERPEVLIGSTYKIKTPISDHAMYVTINDIVLNEGTEYEQRRPFEIFINSKNLDHFQWIVALTRIISAVFRKGGDVTFLVDELKAVFDPRGGYWQPGGKFMPSIIAELGYVIEKHLQTIGLMQQDPAGRAPAEARRREARGVRSALQAGGCLRQEPLPRRRAAVRALQHRGGGHDGRVYDLSELRRFEMRLTATTTNSH
jgi:hypothetical protein